MRLDVSFHPSTYGVDKRASRVCFSTGEKLSTLEDAQLPPRKTNFTFVSMKRCTAKHRRPRVRDIAIQRHSHFFLLGQSNGSASSSSIWIVFTFRIIRMMQDEKCSCVFALVRTSLWNSSRWIGVAANYFGYDAMLGEQTNWILEGATPIHQHINCGKCTRATHVHLSRQGESIRQRKYNFRFSMSPLHDGTLSLSALLTRKKKKKNLLDFRRRCSLVNGTATKLSHKNTLLMVMSYRLAPRSNRLFFEAPPTSSSSFSAHFDSRVPSCSMSSRRFGFDRVAIVVFRNH